MATLQPSSIPFVQVFDVWMAKDRSGRTMLMIAVQSGIEEMITAALHSMNARSLITARQVYSRRGEPQQLVDVGPFGAGYPKFARLATTVRCVCDRRATRCGPVGAQCCCFVNVRTGVDEIGMSLSSVVKLFSYNSERTPFFFAITRQAIISRSTQRNVSASSFD